MQRTAGWEACNGSQCLASIRVLVCCVAGGGELSSLGSVSTQAGTRHKETIVESWADVVVCVAVAVSLKLGDAPARLGF